MMMMMMMTMIDDDDDDDYEDDDDDDNEVLGQLQWKQRLRSLQAQCSAISVRNKYASTSDSEAKCIAFLPKLVVVCLDGGVLQTTLFTGFLDLTKQSAEHFHD